MGLLLRPDFHYAESPAGVYALTCDGPVELRGATAFRLLERLTPYLDGHHDLAELTADLPAERAEMVRRVVAKLRECGALTDVPEDGAPHGDGPAGSGVRLPRRVGIVGE